MLTAQRRYPWDYLSTEGLTCQVLQFFCVPPLHRNVQLLPRYSLGCNGFLPLTLNYEGELHELHRKVPSAPVGENGPDTRKGVCDYLGYLGVKLDDEANQMRGEEKVISAPDSKVTVLCLPTNEELAIARETVALVK